MNSTSKPVVPKKKTLDITNQARALSQKNYVEVHCKFRDNGEELTVKGQSLVQIHGKLSAICQKRGTNYRNAFDSHEVIQ